MYINQIGKIVTQEWLNTPKIRPNFQLDKWVIMPNHLHGIVIINEHILGLGEGNQNILGDHHLSEQKTLNEGNINLLGARDELLRREPNSILSFVAGFKSAVTKRINLLRDNLDIPVWQRNYYESIIRDEQSLIAIQEYIKNNPCQWQKDPDNPVNDLSGQALDLSLYF
jgi:REP element-mobilizing transposase RayT